MNEDTILGAWRRCQAEISVLDVQEKSLSGLVKQIRETKRSLHAQADAWRCLLRETCGKDVPCTDDVPL